MNFTIILSLILLSIIQGITEWLPISSSGILVVLEEIIKFEDKNFNLLFNISVHTGSLTAVIIFFKRDILGLFKNINLLNNIIIATIPAIVFGFLIKILNINIFLQDIKIVTATTLFFSLILYLSDRTKVCRTFDKHISNKHSLYIGLAQALAFIPGTSRSGITITCARYLGFSRIDSSKFSFIISIPTLFAASVLGISDAVLNFDAEIILLLTIGFVTSLIISLVCINFFLKFIKNNTLTLFVIIRIILGLLLIFYLAN